MRHPFISLVRITALICMLSAFGTGGMRSVAGAETVAFEVEGVFRPGGQPQPKDVEEAKAVALRKAMLQGAQRLKVDAAVQRQLVAAVEARDFNGLQPFFTSITILRERKRAGYCDVQLNASLDLGKLRDWCGTLSVDHPLRKKRFMIVIPEYHIAAPIPDPAGETEMIRLFLKDGFRIVDQKQVETIRGKDFVKRAMKGDPKELIAIAEGFGADIIIVGEAFSQDVPRNPRIDGNLFPCRARIEARVILCDTGEILAAGDGEGTAQDLAPAVAAKAAIRTASQKLSESLLKTLLIEGKTDRPIKVILAGVDFEAKVDFKDMLKDMPVIKGIDELSFQESRAEMEIQATVAAPQLAEDIYSVARKKGVKLKVIEQSNARLVFEIVK